MEKKRGRAGAFFLSGLMCLTSLAGLSGSARAAGLEAKCLVPVGHTIGIKLFAEGVVACPRWRRPRAWPRRERPAD